MYKFGDGVTENTDKAFKWALRAAEQGHADAQYNLGVWNGRGEGRPKDDNEAFKWYLEAAKQGNENAAIIVGGRYHSGQGVAKNVILGHAWLLQSDSDIAKRYLALFGQKMTERELEESQSLAINCRQSNFINCS